MSNLRALLHHETVLATYDKGAAGAQTPLFDRFWTNPMNLDTDDAVFLQREDTKTAAPFNKRHAPARQLSLEGKTKKAGAMFHVFNSFRLSPEVFQGLREPESPVIQRKARSELRDQSQHIAKQHANQKELAMAKFLANGVVYVDQASGQIVESSGATVESVSFGIDANHQGTLNGLAVPFDDPHSDINTMMENVRIQAETESAPPPDLCICNSTLKPYIRANTQFQLWAAAMASGERVIYGELVEGLFGMTWLFVDRTYVDSSGTTRKYIPDEKLIMVPSQGDWLQAVQGLELVPTDINIQSMEPEQMANSLAEVYGKFGYGVVNHNPVGLDVYVGDNYGWIVREPNAIWQADVVYS